MHIMQIVAIRLRAKAGDELSANLHHRVKLALVGSDWINHYKCVIGEDRSDCVQILNHDLHKSLPVNLGYLGLRADHFEYQVLEHKVESQHFWGYGEKKDEWIPVAAQ